MFTKKTVRDIDVDNKRVLVRADYNVPLIDGKIADDYRIVQSLSTLQHLLERNAKIIICSHLGRPAGAPDPRYSLRPVADRLAELLGREVQFVGDCVGDVVRERANNLEPGQVLLLENLRFHAEEKQNNEDFGRQLAELAEVFVQDGFGVVHRAHASTDAVTHYTPSVAGLLLEKEVDTITNVTQNPERPLMAIIGGAKIADKIDLIYKFVETADIVAIGGAMANTFLAAEGIDIGKSVFDTDGVETARDILAKAKERAGHERFVMYLPQDGVVAGSLDKMAKTRIVDWDAHVIADIESYPAKPNERTRRINKNEMILDIGPFSGAFIAGSVQLAKTVIWNGTMGVAEAAGVQGPVGPFAHGTDVVVEALLGQFGNKPFTVIGGGDTVSYVRGQSLTDAFGLVSTGGGASLALMAGRELPGVTALQNKEGE